MLDKCYTHEWSFFYESGIFVVVSCIAKSVGWLSAIAVLYLGEIDRLVRFYFFY